MRHQDTVEVVTNKLVRAIEAGVGSWEVPWSSTNWPMAGDRSLEIPEAFFRAVGARVRTGHEAYYNPPTDTVVIPHINQFRTPESYYGILAHEHTHWTGAARRLDRPMDLRYMNVRGQAVEEMVAEMGSAFLLADLDVSVEPLTQHAGYLGWWVREANFRPDILWDVAPHAAKAVEYLERCADRHLVTA